MTSPAQTICKGCEKQGGLYYFKCKECRTRFLLKEPCKKYRAMWAEMLFKKWGDAGDWKQDPSCGCKNTCQRLNNVRGT